MTSGQEDTHGPGGTDPYGTYAGNIRATAERELLGPPAGDDELARALALLHLDADGQDRAIAMAGVHAMMAGAAYTRDLGYAVAELTGALQQYAADPRIPISEIADVSAQLMESMRRPLKGLEAAGTRVPAASIRPLH
jgi:hypothetical protein